MTDPQDDIRPALSPQMDLLDTAWGLIANAGARTGNGWDSQHPEWVQAAERWRDRWHAALKAYQVGQAAPPDGSRLMITMRQADVRYYLDAPELIVDGKWINRAQSAKSGKRGYFLPFLVTDVWVHGKVDSDGKPKYAAEACGYTVTKAGTPGSAYSRRLYLGDKHPEYKAPPRIAALIEHARDICEQQYAFPVQERS